MSDVFLLEELIPTFLFMAHNRPLPDTDRVRQYPGRLPTPVLTPPDVGYFGVLMSTDISERNIVVVTSQ